jgi:hypothetical protein
MRVIFLSDKTSNKICECNLDEPFLFQKDVITLDVYVYGVTDKTPITKEFYVEKVRKTIKSYHSDAGEMKSEMIMIVYLDELPFQP